VIDEDARIFSGRVREREREREREKRGGEEMKCGIVLIRGRLKV
jgi:hypothetical protein